MRRISLPPSPAATSASIRKSMQGNKSANTKPEIMLKVELKKAGIEHFTLSQQELPGSPDLAFPEYKLAIFVHGCFWHRCPYCHPHFPAANKEYWSAKFARNKARDSLARITLRELGWRTITIWECQLKKDPLRVVSRIRKALEKSVG